MMKLGGEISDRAIRVISELYSHIELLQYVVMPK